MSHHTDARPTPADAPTLGLTPSQAPQGRLASASPVHGTSPVAVMAATATTVAILDLATKQIAAFVLGTRGDVSVPLFHHAIRLTVILNDQSAFSVSLGAYTWHINLVLTTVALLLCLSLCRALAVIDRWAPVMLGLITGAATGNLVSLISSPQGVPDFIAVPTGHGHELVFNLADVAAVIGIGLLIRTTRAVARALRAQR
jgi:signal peptidase II